MMGCGHRKVKTAIIVLLLLSILLLSCGCIQHTEKSTTSIENLTSEKSSENKIIFTDASGTRYELSHPVSRIVPYNIPSTEMLVTIGLADKIAGTVDDVYRVQEIADQLPPNAQRIGVLNSPPNLEVVIPLKPEIIITWTDNWMIAANLNKLEKNLTRDINLIRMDFKIKELNNDAYTLGKITDNPEGAKRYIQFNNKYLDLVESRLSNLSPDEIPEIYGESTTDYYVWTPKGYYGQMIDTLHARNVYENQTILSGSVAVTPEWVIQTDPDVIIKMGLPLPYDSPDYSTIYNTISNRTGYDSVKAVQSKRVFIINGRIAHGPRAVIGLVYLAKAIYPDRFADIDPDAIRREYAEEFGFGTMDEEWIYPPFEPVNVTPGGVNGSINQYKTGDAG
jgi:iron complex transport system substrate-binding protein